MEQPSLYEVLMEIKEDIGGIRADTFAVKEQLKLQVARDDATDNRIRQIELEAASARGAARVWSILGTVASTVLGAAAGFFGGRHT